MSNKRPGSKETEETLWLAMSLEAVTEGDPERKLEPESRATGWREDERHPVGEFELPLRVVLVAMFIFLVGGSHPAHLLLPVGDDLSGPLQLRWEIGSKWSRRTCSSSREDAASFLWQRRSVERGHET